LHGYGQAAQDFSNKIKKFTGKLSKYASFHFIDAPFEFEDQGKVGRTWFSNVIPLSSGYFKKFNFFF
jgi:hypothetical protein